MAEALAFLISQMRAAKVQIWLRQSPAFQGKKRRPSAMMTTTMTTRTMNSERFSRTRLLLARAFGEVTQAELAKRIGVTQTVIGKVETEKTQPTRMLAQG